MSEEPSKVDLASPDLAAEKREAFEELFPGVLADGVLDATRLGELLDTPVAQAADTRERFGLMWAGKQEAVRSLLKPSRGALVPDLGNSIDFDTAQNVFIEGDNLEVLKLLQKAYNDRVDVIYIDPPYNTGNDFIYNDNFSDGLRGYLEYTGQLDDEGKLTSTNADTAGRRHSRWLSMMYPRLVLARNLLAQDGVLFVSIDDNEIDNLKKVLDEVFGEENLVAILAVEMSKTQGMKVRAAQNGQLVKNHEYVLVYSRDSLLATEARKPLFDASEIYDDHYDIVWNGGDATENLFDALRSDERAASAFARFELAVGKSGLRRLLAIDDEFSAYFLESWASRVYRESPIALRDIQALDLAVGKVVTHDRYILRKNSKGTVVQLQAFADGIRTTDDYKPRRSRATIRGALWKGFHSDMMNVGKEGGVEFKNGKKPVRLIKQLIKWANRSDGLILDFFAGSGTTAHAVALQNAEDGGHRRAVCVNIPEPTAEDSAAHEAGFNAVSEITLARLSWVSENIDGAAAQGLRVLNLSSSSFQTHEAAGSQLDLSETTLVDEEPYVDDIVGEVLLKEGVMLDSSWERHQVGGDDAVVADGVAVVVSLDITDEVVDGALALKPRVLVFLEDGFAGKDAVKANAFTRARNAGITMKTV
jgi:adenine-specific DNA-methyltransferase